MLLLVSGATKTVREWAHHPNLGVLLTPDAMQPINKITLPWAADNAAFVGFKPDKFMKMLDKMEGQKPLFVSCPDVVADAEKTLQMFDEWQTIIAERGFSVAFVLQDGQDEATIPWDRMGALFIGGTTEYKLGLEARKIVTEAKRRGKWVHMGRVNTPKRIVYAREIGCDSIDGTGFSMFANTHIPWALNLIATEQLTLFPMEGL
jgi:hypothetical protein